MHKLASKADDARERSPIRQSSSPQRSPKRAPGKHKRIQSALGSPNKSAYSSVPSKVY